jgi:hypothetical protein
VNWFTEEGEDLMESLVLSDKAKMFAIAREVQYLKSYYVYNDAFFKSAFFITALSAGMGLDRMGRTRRDILARVGICAIVVAVTGVLYVFGKDTYTCSLDTWADKKAASLSKDFAEGGAEFYSKTMLRNRSLRTLMGAAGSSFYNINGNEIETIRRSHPILSTRKEQCFKILEELRSKDKTYTDEDEPSM